MKIFWEGYNPACFGASIGFQLMEVRKHFFSWRQVVPYLKCFLHLLKHLILLNVEDKITNLNVLLVLPDVTTHDPMTNYPCLRVALCEQAAKLPRVQQRRSPCSQPGCPMLQQPHEEQSKENPAQPLQLLSMLISSVRHDHCRQNLGTPTRLN